MHLTKRTQSNPNFIFSFAFIIIFDHICVKFSFSSFSHPFCIRHFRTCCFVWFCFGRSFVRAIAFLFVRFDFISPEFSYRPGLSVLSEDTNNAVPPHGAGGPPNRPLPPTPDDDDQQGDRTLIMKRVSTVNLVPPLLFAHKNENKNCQSKHTLHREIYINVMCYATTK